MRLARRLLAVLVLAAAVAFGAIRFTGEGEPTAPGPDLSATVTAVDSLWTGEGWTVDRTIGDPFEPTFSAVP